MAKRRIAFKIGLGELVLDHLLDSLAIKTSFGTGGPETTAIIMPAKSGRRRCMRRPRVILPTDEEDLVTGIST